MVIHTSDRKLKTFAEFLSMIRTLQLCELKIYQKAGIPARFGTALEDQLDQAADQIYPADPPPGPQGLLRLLV